ncbi:hypothetical protein FRB94_003163 [Tulasnella sp. JGI-2019a]|nr:hypothetical protein FRB94_003163 [Tulasnella sp. JGI-2019a]
MAENSWDSLVNVLQDCSLAYTEHKNLIQNITLTGSTSPNYIIDMFRQADSFKQGWAVDDPTGIQALFAKATSPSTISCFFCEQKGQKIADCCLFTKAKAYCINHLHNRSVNGQGGGQGDGNQGRGGRKGKPGAAANAANANNHAANNPDTPAGDKMAGNASL